MFIGCDICVTHASQVSVVRIDVICQIIVADETKQDTRRAVEKKDEEKRRGEERRDWMS